MKTSDMKIKTVMDRHSSETEDPEKFACMSKASHIMWIPFISLPDQCLSLSVTFKYHKHEANFSNSPGKAKYSFKIAAIFYAIII